MRCDYCGRTNTNDGHDGCIKCGAPLPAPPPYIYIAFPDATCVSTMHPGPQQPITRKKVTIG